MHRNLEHLGSGNQTILPRIVLFVLLVLNTRMFISCKLRFRIKRDTVNNSHEEELVLHCIASFVSFNLQQLFKLPLDNCVNAEID